MTAFEFFALAALWGIIAELRGERGKGLYILISLSWTLGGLLAFGTELLA